MSAKMNVPELRFKEFSEGWEEKLVIDFAPLQRGFDLPVSTIKKGEFPVVFSNGILKYHNEYKALAPGVVTGRSGTIGNVTYVEDNYWPHNTALWVTDFKNNIPKFVYYFYDRFNLAKFGTGSGVPTLNRNDVHRQKILVPYSRDEQEKIASFLSSVDTKIGQLTKKQTLLEQYKKGVMQKIFSQEIRFRDDDGGEYPEWVEKKLGEVATFLKGKGISKSDILEDGNLECVRYGELYTLYKEQIVNIKSKTNLNKDDLILSKYNDVIIPASGETQIDIATASCVLKDDVALSGDLNIIRTKENGIYLAYYLNNKKKIDIAKMAQGNSVVHLYSSQLKQLKVSLPSLEEQTKIANFLSCIDTKIEQLTKQLNSTKLFKKALLQKMFI